MLNTAAGLGGVSVNTGAVTSGSSGIVVRNLGAGTTTLSSSGTVSSPNGLLGVSVTDNAAAGAMTIAVAGVNGGANGLYAHHLGGGALSVTAVGPVTGAMVSGLTAKGGAAGSDLTVAAASVSSASGGSVLIVDNAGSGATTVSASGIVTAAMNYGIETSNTVAAHGDLTVTAAQVTGATDGIHAHNFGSGSLNVTATGLVTSGVNSDGVFARSEVGGQNVTVVTGAVTGDAIGIYAGNRGVGAVTVNAQGPVSAARGTGIQAINQGVGATTVTAVGSVSSGVGPGISATNTAVSTGNLIVTSGQVTGGPGGIYAKNSGSGALQVTSTGAVSGAGATGILAVNTLSASNLSVQAASASGSYGVYAANNGTGSTSIAVSGTVTSSTTAGVLVKTSATTLGPVTVGVTGSVLASGLGVKLTNLGAGRPPSPRHRARSSAKPPMACVSPTRRRPPAW